MLALLIAVTAGAMPARGQFDSLGVTRNPSSGTDAADTGDRLDIALDRPVPPNHSPKYVFFFVGDGMAHAQIHATEAYLAAEMHYASGEPKARLLTMSQFPVQGMSSTYADNRFITGSAAAGTALACGHKTSIGVVAMDPTGMYPYTTIAELAKRRDKKVGIVTSVSLDHATPAAFYAHQPSRSMYHEIAMEMAHSDFDYFGGGGFRQPIVGSENALTTAQANGFTLVTTRAALASTEPGDRVIAYNHTLASGESLYYDIDRPASHVSLAEFTAEGIRLLDNPEGFFLMVESGKIDWACHANDARTVIAEMLAFDAAIAEAVAFYERHPDETLILVVSDHECGGMTIGFAGTRYETAFELLDGQTMSFEMFNWRELPGYIASHPWTSEADNIDDDLKDLIEECFGLVYDDFTAHERRQLEAAYDRTRFDAPMADPDEDYLLYGNYEALTVTLTHLLNHQAGLSWTSYAHTGVPVPVLAIGRGAETFDGFYDNVDIARKLAVVMRVQLDD
jgi:alkaline phosphatase